MATRNSTPAEQKAIRGAAAIEAQLEKTYSRDREANRKHVPLYGPWGFDTYISADANPGDIRNLAESFLSVAELIFDEDDPEGERHFSPSDVSGLWFLLASSRALLQAATDRETAQRETTGGAA